MFYEPKDGAQDMAIDPFKNLVVPRPIGWVTSLDAEGRVNLAPFSFFNAMSEDPPTVAFSPSGRKPDRPIKDTRANIEATGEFVCNLATGLREAMNATSATLPAGVDEMQVAGLTAAPSRLVCPPAGFRIPTAARMPALEGDRPAELGPRGDQLHDHRRGRGNRYRRSFDQERPRRHHRRPSDRSAGRSALRQRR